jgi:DNA-binding protein HU-beta
LSTKSLKKTPSRKRKPIAFVLTVFQEIIASLKEGDSVTVVGFGTFKVMNCAARIGRNPATGKSIKIPPMLKPKFIPGTYFKEVLNEKK